MKQRGKVTIGEVSAFLRGILFYEKSSIKFFIGVVVGLAFSISVILSTIGIMNGFVLSLRDGLKKSSGDVVINSRFGFFTKREAIGKVVEELKIQQASFFLQTQGFLISNEVSKGVLVKGVDKKSYTTVTELKLNFSGDDEVVIGSELAKAMQIKLGDEVVLGVAKGNKRFKSLPLLRSFRVSQIITHGIYQKDLRIIYVNKTIVQEMLELDDRVNLVTMNVPNDIDEIEEFISILKNKLGMDFTIRPYWREYSGLLEAVEVEKLAIGLVLQLIVIISIFNVLSFIIFLNEKRVREIFLFKALGMSIKRINHIWAIFIVKLWFLACGLSIVFAAFFNICLENLSVFKVPGEIYSLGHLSVVLSVDEYLLVFALTMVWLIFISWVGLLRFQNKQVLSGLRREFA
ncbi:MAG: ABC transporter permease [Bacteriovoracaceae bacterium]|nr:ABC transporter permease [Bacteriovoracaceae bacterium]